MAIFAINSWIGEINQNVFLNDDDFKKQQQKISQLISKLKNIQKPAVNYQQNLKFISKHTEQLWDSKRDGKAHIEMGTIIKDLAAQSGFEFGVVGGVATSRDQIGLKKYSVRVNGNCSKAQFAMFCNLLSHQKIKFFWSSLKLMNRYKVNENITITGTLMTLSIDDKNLLKSLTRINKQRGKK